MIRVNIVKNEMIIKSVSSFADEGVLMAWAQENEKSPGHCIFTDDGEILELKDNDEVFELLIRAALNYLDINGINSARCKNELLFDGLKKLGFKEIENFYCVNIKEFFKPCCHK